MSDPRLRADLDAVLTHTREVWDALRDARIFLTGGTGFFGMWLLESFTHAVDELQISATITVLTRDPERFSTRAPHLASHRSVTLHRGDVRTFAFPEGTFSHMIHGATEVVGTLNAEQPDVMRETIVRGTERVLEFAEHAGVTSSLLLSSGAVYGRQPPEVTHMPEDDGAIARPLERPSAYAEGKRTAETLWNSSGRVCRSAAHTSAAGPIARGFAFVGPHLALDAHFAIGNFLQDALAGRPIEVTGDGTPRRSYLYAADLAIWLWTILVKGTPGRAYNVGSEDDRSIAEIARAVSECVSSHPPVVITGIPVPGAPPERYVPSTARARSELGLKQTIPLEEAIRRTAAWYSLRPLPPTS